LTQEQAEITVRGLPRTENCSGQSQARGAAPELRLPARPPRPWEAFHGVPIAAYSPASARPLDLPWERSDARGAWGHVATTRSTCHRQPSSGTRVHRLSPGTYRACDRGPPALRLAWYALLPSLVARPEWLSCWCAPRGRALTQEPSGITLQTLARREERQQRTSDRSGTAVYLQERSAIRRAP
jgi:hypothetical protein